MAILTPDEMRERRNRPLSIESQKAYLAYIDILGFSELIKSIGNENIEEKDGLFFLDNIVTLLKQRMDYDNEFHPDLDYFFISDSIILISPDFKRICWKASQISDSLIQQGFLTRGGISYGTIILSKDEHIKDDIFKRKNIYGVPLIEAYELEKKYAVHPRIIIQKEIEENFFDESWTNEIIRTDIDGWRYIDHFARRYNKGISYNDLPAFLTTVKNVIERNLKLFALKPEYSKWYWIRTQFNRLAEKNGHGSFVIE